jgi:prepilin-type N-terminal cleavage/methylation domain-containing protein
MNIRLDSGNPKKSRSNVVSIKDNSGRITRRANVRPRKTSSTYALENKPETHIVRFMDAMNQRHGTRGFSFIEILIAIAIIALLAGLLLPALARAKSKAIQTNCLSNLRMVGISFRLWGDDNQDTYPMLVPAAKGGAKEAVLKGDVFRAFQCMSNELSTTKILVCPADVRPRAADFLSLKNANISYFACVDATELNPRLWLTGDRNLAVNDGTTENALVSVKTSDRVWWTPQVHRGTGNLGLADGSVQVCTTPRLQTALQDTGTNMQRLAFP